MTKIPLGAAKDSKLIAISTVPSFNYTSHKKDTVAGYVLYQVIDNSVNTATQTSFNGRPVYLLEKTIQPTCKGDEAGIGGGVISGTVGGEVKPTSGSSTVFVEGKALVREGDTCTMNNENTVGEYTTMDHTTMARIALAQAELDHEEEQEYQITAGSGSGVAKDELDTSKFYFGGDKEMKKAFDKIISTSHGRYIVSVIQNDDKVIAVEMKQGNGPLLGKNIMEMESVIVEDVEWWEKWKSPKRKNKVIMRIEINMNAENPYLVRADSKHDGKMYTGVFKPDLTRVLAHELGHGKNYSTHNRPNYNHQAIQHENTIMRQLDRNAIIRHPSADHGDIFYF